MESQRPGSSQSLPRRAPDIARDAHLDSAIAAKIDERKRRGDFDLCVAPNVELPSSRACLRCRWRLFGSAFKDAASAFAPDLSLSRRHSVTPQKPFTEAWLVCGRRSGKSFVMALIAVFLACFRDYREYLGPGEKCTIMIVAADRKQARVVIRFVRGLLAAPVLAKRVVNDVSDAIELEGDVIIEVITASHAARGYALGVALVDELAFFPSDDASISGAEIIAAIRPAMLTIPGSLLVCASSPYSRRGPLWDAFRRFHGRDDASVLVWRAPTLVMNPSVPKSVIDDACEADPASAAAEYGAEFRTDVETFVSREAVEACVSLGVRERPPMSGEVYSGLRRSERRQRRRHDLGDRPSAGRRCGDRCAARASSAVQPRRCGRRVLGVAEVLSRDDGQRRPLRGRMAEGAVPRARHRL